MKLKWIKTIKLVTQGDYKIVAQGWLRSDGKWTMAEMSDSVAYMSDIYLSLAGRELDPDYPFHNDGGQEKFERRFEERRVKYGLLYAKGDLREDEDETQSAA